jgi:hypothetical protein
MSSHMLAARSRAPCHHLCAISPKLALLQTEALRAQDTEDFAQRSLQKDKLLRALTNHCRLQLCMPASASFLSVRVRAYYYYY